MREHLDSPARTAEPIARDLLDDLLLGLRDLPQRADRGAAAASIEAAVAAITAWAATGIEHPDHITRLDEALVHLRSLDGDLSKIDGSVSARLRARAGSLAGWLGTARERSLDLFAARADRLLRASREEPSSPASFRASRGTPELHRLPGERARPEVTIPGAHPEDDEAEAGLAALLREADGEDGDEPAAVTPAPAEGEALQLERLGRDCLEDIANLGTLRRRNDDEDWTAVAPFEQRLLDNLDALVALGLGVERGQRALDVRALTLQYAGEATFADGGRAFARALVLGSLAGDDGVRAAVLGLRQSHPSTHLAQQEAFSLAPSPAIDGAMLRLLHARDPEMVTVALEVLRFRRSATLGSVMALLRHPDPRVAAGAARCLGASDAPAAAAPLLEQLLDDGGDEELAVTAAESLLRLGAASGLAHVRRALTRELEQPGALPEGSLAMLWRLLGLAGSGEDADLVLRAPHRAVGAAGWLGSARVVGRLIELLAAANEVRPSIGLATPFEIELASSLHRITGFELRVTGGDVPTTQVSTTLSVDARAWAAEWERRGDGFAAGTRYRFGKPYSPLLSLEELRAPATPPGARADAALELAIVARGLGRLEPTDWVARQLGDLERAREHLARAAVSAGEFPGRRLGR